MSCDTLLLTIAKNPSAEIGFRRPYCHNQTAKVWAEEGNGDANTTIFNWTFSDNPIIDSVLASTTDSIYYPHWNQTDCNSLTHMVSLQTSNNWACHSETNTVSIKDLEIPVPLTNNIQPILEMSNGIIRLVNDSMVDCNGVFAYPYTHCWINSTLQSDLANNIPDFEEQINFGANCVMDSLYGLLVQDSSWLVIQYTSLLSLDSNYVYPAAVCKDTIMLQVGNNTVIESLTFNKLLKIYPNPAQEQLTIVGLDKFSINKIEILDISGKLVKSFSTFNVSEEFKINISDLNEGIYFIKLGKYVTKFVKQ